MPRIIHIINCAKGTKYTHPCIIKSKKSDLSYKRSQNDTKKTQGHYLSISSYYRSCETFCNISEPWSILVVLHRLKRQVVWKMPNISVPDFSK